jgi:hypothetical protein
MVSCKQSTEENFLKRIKEMNNTNGYNPFPPSLLRDFEGVVFGCFFVFYFEVFFILLFFALTACYVLFVLGLFLGSY